MYLSDTQIEDAIDSGALILDPRVKVDPTSIDLHLDGVDQAKVWDLGQLAKHNRDLGLEERELKVARMNYGLISRRFLVAPPHEREKKADDLVFRRDDSIVLKSGGFLLWQTREEVGTPEIEPRYICFIDGKSTRARTGLVVHLTAPTIHAGWAGQVTLEMTNCGPLDLVLHEGDAVAQIVIAQITSPPRRSMRERGSATLQQRSVSGADTTDCS